MIARGTEEENEVLWVEIRQDGVTGRGEAAPIPRYDESAQSALAYAEEQRPRSATTHSRWRRSWRGCRRASSPRGPRSTPRCTTSRASSSGSPSTSCSGCARVGPPTSWTIWLGDPDDMARRAEAVAGRFQRLKLKLGGGDGRDVDRVRAVREVADVPLQVDVNEAWSARRSARRAPAARRARRRVLRAAARRPATGRAELKQRSPIPIYVDEDCHTLRDVAACAERAHGINVKLAKSGGIREAVRMVHAARALDLGCMLGCMIESGLGIAAGAHIASLFDHVDLDGNLLLAHDPWPGVQFVDGVQLPAELPGLGVSRRDATRYLILAEGFSGDPLYGKTMRGVLRYRRDDVVAILDSTRAPGDTEQGVPIVQSVDEALGSSRTPRSSASRRRAATSRLPGSSC